jgi:hypothetical protein
MGLVLGEEAEHGPFGMGAVVDVGHGRFPAQ